MSNPSGMQADIFNYSGFTPPFDDSIINSSLRDGNDESFYERNEGSLHLELSTSFEKLEIAENQKYVYEDEKQTENEKYFDEDEKQIETETETENETENTTVIKNDDTKLEQSDSESEEEAHFTDSDDKEATDYTGSENEGSLHLELSTSFEKLEIAENQKYVYEDEKQTENGKYFDEDEKQIATETETENETENTTVIKNDDTKLEQSDSESEEEAHFTDSDDKEATDYTGSENDVFEKVKCFSNKKENTFDSTYTLLHGVNNSTFTYSECSFWEENENNNSLRLVEQNVSRKTHYPSVKKTLNFSKTDIKEKVDDATEGSKILNLSDEIESKDVIYAGKSEGSFESDKENIDCNITDKNLLKKDVKVKNENSSDEEEMNSKMKKGDETEKLREKKKPKKRVEKMKSKPKSPDSEVEHRYNTRYRHKKMDAQIDSSMLNLESSAQKSAKSNRKIINESVNTVISIPDDAISPILRDNPSGKIGKTAKPQSLRKEKKKVVKNVENQPIRRSSRLKSTSDSTCIKK